MCDFSFGVLTYNSGEFVVETLNSILFQIRAYGYGRSCELIISDDCSRDATLSKVKEWVDNNSKSFCNVKVLSSSINEGTVRNFNKCFRHMQGEKFHIIAGDDLYLDTDLFSIVDMLNDHAIVSSIPICFNEIGLFWDENRLNRHVLKMNHGTYMKDELISRLIIGSFIHSPSTLFRKELYTNDVIDFVEQFKLFEDDPQFFSFFQNTNDVVFIDKPFILYRYHKQSVCHASGGGELFREDYLKLYKIYREYAKGIFIRMYITSKSRQITYDNRFSLADLYRYIEGKWAKFIVEHNRKLLMKKREFYEYDHNVGEFISRMKS